MILLVDVYLPWDIINTCNDDDDDDDDNDDDDDDDEEKDDDNDDDDDGDDDDDDVEVHVGNSETPLNMQKQSNYTYQLSSRVFKVSNFFGYFIKAFLHGSILTLDFFKPFLHLVLLSFYLHKLFTGSFIFLKSINMLLAAGNASLKSCI